MKMKTSAATAVCIAAMAFGAKAVPVTYDFTFGSIATGQLVVDSGSATSGYLDITSGTGTGHYGLYTWTGGGISSVRVNGGTDLIVDNLVNPGSNPALDVYGLAFVNGDGDMNGYPDEGIGLSLLSGTTINLSGYGNLGWGVPNVNADFTLTEAPPDSGSTHSVPDGGNTLGLAGLGLGGLLLLKKLLPTSLAA